MRKITIFDLNYMPVLVLSIIKGLDLSFNNFASIVVFSLSILICLPTIIKLKFTIKEYIILTLLLVLGILILFFGKTPTFILLGLMLLFMKTNNIMTTLRIIMISFFICFILKLTLSLFDINRFISYTYRNGIAIKRYSFGYSHPNYCHLLFFITTLLYLTIHNDNINFKKIIILCIFNAILYKFTVSRTGVIVCFSLYIISYLCKKSNLCQKLILNTGIIIILSLLPITILLGLFYDKIPIISILDNFTTGRIHYISELIKYKLPPLLGSQEFNMIVNFDNGYMSLLYEIGILGTLIIYILLIKTLLIIRHSKAVWLMLALLIISVYGLTESFWPSISINFSLYFLAYSIYDRKGELNCNEINNNIYSNI